MNKEITMNIKDCEQAKSGDCCYCENMAYTKLKAELEALNNCDKTLIYKQARNNFEKLKKIEELCKELMSENEEYISINQVFQIIRGED